jgi:hypothetical protein
MDVIENAWLLIGWLSNQIFFKIQSLALKVAINYLDNN